MTSKIVSSSARRTSSTQSSGTPNAMSFELAQLSNSFGFGAAARRGATAASVGAASSTRSRISTICMAPVVGCALDAPPLGPAIGLVVVVDVGEQQARGGAVDDEPDVRVHPHGPEALVLRAVELVEGQAGRGGIHLQVEGGHLHRLLLLAGQAAEAVGEGVGDAEVH